MKNFCFAVTLFFVSTTFAYSPFIFGSAGNLTAQLCTPSEHQIKCVPINEKVLKDPLGQKPSALQIAERPTDYVDPEKVSNVLRTPPTTYCAYSFESISSKPRNPLRYAIGWKNIHGSLSKLTAFSPIIGISDQKTQIILKYIRDAECDVAIYSEIARAYN